MRMTPCVGRPSYGYVCYLFSWRTPTARRDPRERQGSPPCAFRVDGAENAWPRKMGRDYRARCPRRFDSSRCFVSNSPGSDCRGRCFGLRASRGPKFRKRFFRHYRLDAGVSAVQCLRSNEKPSPQDTLKAGASGQRCLLTSRSASFPAWPHPEAHRPLTTARIQGSELKLRQRDR